MANQLSMAQRETILCVSLTKPYEGDGRLA